MAELITIVGGAFGAYLGKMLSSEGEKVILYEKQRNRHVICGGLVNRKSIRRFGLKNYVINWVDGAIVTAGEEELEINKKRVAGVLDRDAMFRGILEEAEAAGVSVMYKTWRGERGGVLVGADGAASSLRKEVTDRRVNYILAVQARTEYDSDKVRVDFGPWSPSFFGWIIPLGDGTSHIGVGIPPSEGRGWKKYLNMYASFLQLSYWNPEARIIPISPPLWTVKRRNVYLLGDAAVQTKATTGGGITYGLSAAHLLARDILNGEDYNILHRRYIYPRLLLHWFIHKILYSLPLPLLLRWIKENYLSVLSTADMDDPFTIMHPKLLTFIPQTFFHALNTLLRPS